MHIIADSSSTRTQWVMAKGSTIMMQATTAGINPYFHTRREISHIIRLGLPEDFFRRRWYNVFFYGSGCANEQKNKIVEQCLVAQFKTPCTVNSNLLGAARGLLVRRSGLACILGTGSNSCYYDGENITRTVRPLGFVLGDEGSKAYLGKALVANVLKELAPQHICEAFYKKFNVSTDQIMDSIYTESLPSLTLAEYSSLLADLIDDPYVHRLVYDAFMAFFTRNISRYDYCNKPISFVGSAAVAYSDILHEAANDFGASIRDIRPDSMPGLVEFHAT